MSKPVLIVGDVAFDSFYDLEPRGHSHGVPVFSNGGTADRAWNVGCAGYVARTLSSISTEAPSLFVVVEQEYELQAMADRLEGVSVYGMESPNWPTPAKKWHRMSGEIIARHDFEASRTMDPKTQRIFVRALRRHLRSSDYGAIVFSDYIKGTISEKVSAAIIKTARELNIPVLVDTKRRDLKRFEGASSIQVADGMDRHVNWPECEAIFLTEGAKGVTLVQDGRIAHFDALSNNPINVIGAGDAFLAGCAKGIVNGGSWGDAAQWGNLAAKWRVEVAPEVDFKLEPANDIL